jgi:hypothetical protein
MIRAVVASPGALLWICGVRCPNVELFSAAVGAPNITLFVRLNASARKINVSRSRILKFRESDRSIFHTSGPEIVNGLVVA